MIAAAVAYGGLNRAPRILILGTVWEISDRIHPWVALIPGTWEENISA